MKRLTKSGGSYCDNCSAVNDEFCSCCDEKAMYKKLSEYEDTGLEPNEMPKWISVKDRMPESGVHVLLETVAGAAEGGKRYLVMRADCERRKTSDLQICDFGNVRSCDRGRRNKAVYGRKSRICYD